MMYQCLSDILPAPSPADAENKGHEEAHELIGHEKEDGSDCDHHEDHGGGDRGLASAGPRDLLRLRAHFLQEFKRTDLRHMPYLPPSRACGRNPLRFLDYRWPRRTLRLAGVEGLEPPTPGFGDRCSSH